MDSKIAEHACTRLNAMAEANGWPLSCDPAMAFERPELCALHELWCAKATAGVPRRSVFDIRALKPVASCLIILEREGEGAARRYRFRLFGSGLAILFGEHTGRYVDEMVAPELLAVWHATYDTVLETGEPLRIVNLFRNLSGDYLKGELLAAPLADEAGQPRLIMAATFVGLKDAVIPFSN